MPDTPKTLAELREAILNTPLNGDSEWFRNIAASLITAHESAAKERAAVLVKELAGIQKLASAAEFGEVDAHEALMEIAARLGYLGRAIAVHPQAQQQEGGE